MGHARVDLGEIGIGIEEVDLGAEEMVEQEIALIEIRAIAAQDEDGLHAVFAGRSSRHAGVVGLVAAGGDEHLDTLGDGIGHQVFELAHLVAPTAEAGEIVPLDRKRNSKLGAQAFHLLDRRRQIAKGEPGDRFEFHADFLLNHGMRQVGCDQQ
ncbi:hypothetical protein D3C86_1768720 [compost metagenome]